MCKKASFIDLICLICLIGLIGPIACSPKEPAPDPFARPTYDPTTVLQNSNFKAVADASLVTVHLMTDKTVPVKGSLNIKDGHLSLARDDRNHLTEFDLTIDETSWDSGLTERDDLVRKLFFPQSGQGIRLSFSLLDQKLIETLRQQKKLASFNAILSLTWGDAVLTVNPTLSISVTPQGYVSVSTLQPVPLKISELKHQGQLTQLIEAAITTRKEMSIDDVIQVEISLEFEPVIPKS